MTGSASPFVIWVFEKSSRAGRSLRSTPANLDTSRHTAQPLKTVKFLPIVITLAVCLLASCAKIPNKERLGFPNGHYAMSGYMMTKDGSNEFYVMDFARNGSYVLTRRILIPAKEPDGMEKVMRSVEKGTWIIESGVVILTPETKAGDSSKASTIPAYIHRLVPKGGDAFSSAEYPDIILEKPKPVDWEKVLLDGVKKRNAKAEFDAGVKSGKLYFYAIGSFMDGYSLPGLTQEEVNVTEKNDWKWANQFQTDPIPLGASQEYWLLHGIVWVAGEWG